MAPAIRGPAARAWSGRAASRLDETPSLRAAGARLPLTTVDALATG